MSPITMTLRDAIRFTGLSRSTLYRLLQQGKIVAVNARVATERGRTLFMVDSLVAYVASLQQVIPTGKL